MSICLRGMVKMNYKDVAYLFKVLSDETRLKIIKMLKSGTMCACKLLEEFEITQPTLSYHMKMLVESELVFSEKNGIWNNYTLNIQKLEELLNFTQKILFEK